MKNYYNKKEMIDNGWNPSSSLNDCSMEKDGRVISPSMLEGYCGGCGDYCEQVESGQYNCSNIEFRWKL